MVTDKSQGGYFPQSVETMSQLETAPSSSGLESLGCPKPTDKVFTVHMQASAGQANKDQGLEAGVSRG